MCHAVFTLFVESERVYLLSVDEQMETKCVRVSLLRNCRNQPAKYRHQLD